MNTVVIPYSLAPLSWPPETPRTVPAERRDLFESRGRAVVKRRFKDVRDSVVMLIEGMDCGDSIMTYDLSLTDADPGVCVYFSRRASAYACVCDSYTSVGENILAVAWRLAAEYPTVTVPDWLDEDLRAAVLIRGPRR